VWHRDIRLVAEPSTACVCLRLPGHWPCLAGLEQLNSPTLIVGWSSWEKMRKLAVPLALVAALAFALPAGAAQSEEVYRATVTRATDNAYVVGLTDLLVITRLCLNLALNDNAVLVYEPGYRSNFSIIFSDGQSCDVDGVYRSNANLRRVADNLYQDTLTGGYLRTQLCLSLALGERSLVLSDRVVFLDSRQGCQLAF
jgi:hypothetical protein